MKANHSWSGKKDRNDLFVCLDDIYRVFCFLSGPSCNLWNLQWVCGWVRGNAFWRGTGHSYKNLIDFLCVCLSKIV